MTWILFSLVSNAAIITTEYLNQGHTGSWLTVLPRTGPLILVAQFCLFRSFNGAPHWLLAWAVFSVGNSVMRVAAVRLFGAGVESWPYALVGISAMIAGAFIVKESLS